MTSQKSGGIRFRVDRMRIARFSVCSLFLIACCSRFCEASSATEVKRVLEKHCYACHANGNNRGGVGNFEDLKKIAASDLVVAKNLVESRLYQVLISGEMPRKEGNSNYQKPTSQEIDSIGRWIAEGTPTAEDIGNKPAGRPVFTLRDELELILGELQRLEADDRASTRFFSLRSLHNTPSRTLQEIDYARAAFGKVLNSLHWKSRIIAPRRLGKDSLVFAIDTRDLDWPDTGWGNLLQQYPYGLKHDLLPGSSVINELAEQVYTMTGTDLPVIRIDWFIARATRPPIYHELLRIPETVVELEKTLAVHCDSDIRQARSRRAGFTNSGISEQNRLIERFEGTFGYYWKSYDFKPDNAKSDLKKLPLGPAFSDHPFPHLSFVHDGGELIFRLPNGLQGYMLVDDVGKRINTGPTEIVADLERISGELKIINGLSCMACHKQGIITKKDVIRDETTIGPEAQKFAKRLYPPQPEMDALYQKDSNQFRVAVLEAMKSTAMDQSMLARADGTSLEPVSSIARFYQLQPLGVEEIAGELGIPVADLTSALKFNDRLQKLGLTVSGDPLKRVNWESLSGGQSLYQQAALFLKLGVPKSITQ